MGDVATMKLNGLLDFGARTQPVVELVADLRAGRMPAPLGVHHAARPYLVAILAQALIRPLVVVTARSNRARQWVDELRIWLPDDVPVHVSPTPMPCPTSASPGRRKRGNGAWRASPGCWQVDRRRWSSPPRAP